MTAFDDVIANTTDIADGLVVHPAGDIDFSRSPNLRNELMQLMQNKSPAKLVINLAKVEYMDSSGVATLVEAMQMQSKRKGRLVLCQLQPKVESIFKISRLDMVFTIVNDEQQAVEA